MNYLRGFIPWIVFAAVGSAHWQWGALAALVAGGYLFAMDRKRGLSADALILEQSTIAFFAVLSVIAFAAPDSALRGYGGALATGWLALTAWATLAVRKPFTTGIAKRQAPREVWTNPVFLRINVVLTSVWALAFTLTATALAVIDAESLGSTASIAVQVAGFAIPVIVTAQYPERARRAAVQKGA
ncbi:hypothetical protein GCM10010331_52620 [Streptomyces xanthochromogenes]|uniref:hypothetical protein n=1 Tax=Streptomyces xanthochromogenes TaxID=67384 RepID=UPI001671A41F|nr:hypothetical protein [Streptomyces xanthochromogenes]GHB58382.1 hypothetical protein GCM10010331_52620 [Streptomyces xanthochromogenes]